MTEQTRPLHDEQVRHLARRLKIPLPEADHLLANMETDDE